MGKFTGLTDNLRYSRNHWQLHETIAYHFASIIDRVANRPKVLVDRLSQLGQGQLLSGNFHTSNPSMFSISTPSNCWAMDK